MKIFKSTIKYKNIIEQLACQNIMHYIPIGYETTSFWENSRSSIFTQKAGFVAYFYPKRHTLPRYLFLPKKT
jgi:hypothetical protein